MRKLIATLVLALVAFTTVEAQQQAVVEGVRVNLYLTDYVELYNKKVDIVTERINRDVRIVVSSDRSMVWEIFEEEYFNVFETFFVEDRGDYYLLKAIKMHTYENKVLSKSEYLELYVIVFKGINRVELTDGSEHYIIYRGL